MKKIYFIIFLSAAVRLYHIDFPVLGWHSWRQSDTAAIARNFLYNGYNILYPQIDWNASGTGYVESEFHIYPFVVSLFYSLFGVDDMYGRSVSVIFSLFTIYGIYLLVRKIINEETALWSSFIYAILPLNIFYGRAFMPESAMLMCSVYSVYFFSEWIDKNEKKYFIYSWIFTSLAILIKIPTLYIGLPLLFLAYQKDGKLFYTNLKLWLLAVLIFLPVALWYWHAHQLYLNNGATFGIWTFGRDKWGMIEQLLDPSFYHKVVLMDLAERHLTYPGFVLLIIGVFVRRQNKFERLFDYWLIAVIIYFLIASHAVRVHEYYQLPFVLPVSVFLGKSLNKLIPAASLKYVFTRFNVKAYFAAMCIILIAILSFLRVANFMKSEDWNSPVFKIANDVKSNSNKSDLIITVSNGDPVYLYHCDRKGWTVLPENLDNNYLSQKINEGAKFVAGEKNKFESQKQKVNLMNILDKYEVIHNDDDYFVVKLITKIMIN